MFSKNTYLLQQDSPNSLHDLNGDEILPSHHHHQDILSSHYPVTDPPVLFNQDVGHGLNGDPSAMANTSCYKTAKKDRHSKIHTAQGPRDRRVRLSIGVARKFFDLQEMLGFEQPSKTLDWLLTKSKTAIKHLVQTKQQGCSKSVVSSLSECEENNNNNNNNNIGECFFENANKSLEKKGKSATMTTNANKKNKGAYKDAQQQAALNLAKESRVKARARARERTREKMCIKQQQQINETSGYDNLNPSSSIPIQYMNNQLEVCRISGSGGIMHCPSAYEAAHHQEDLIQESGVIKRKVKHNPSIFGFQPNYSIPSSYNNAAENWDISNFASQSSICAILDQHKFNNSSSDN